MAGLRWKDCLVFIQPNSITTAVSRRYPLYVDEAKMECKQLNLSITWYELRQMSEDGEMESWPQGNSTILRLGEDEYKITVYLPVMSFLYN